jgi:hypothetical protein
MLSKVMDGEFYHVCLQCQDALPLIATAPSSYQIDAGGIRLIGQLLEMGSLDGCDDRFDNRGMDLGSQIKFNAADVFNPEPFADPGDVPDRSLEFCL